MASVEFSNQFVDELSDFLREEIAKLDRTFIWPVSKWDGFHAPAETSRLQATLSLRQHLHQEWLENRDRPKIAEWLVKQWGGIRTNLPETLASHLVLVEQENRTTPLEGVSAYSKILSIAYPDACAIYDARVAVSLISIQIVLRTQEGIYFPVPDSQNRLLRAFCKKHPSNHFVEQGWQELPADEAYEAYLKLMQMCLLRLADSSISLAILEMALFVAADKFVTDLRRPSYVASSVEEHAAPA